MSTRLLSFATTFLFLCACAGSTADATGPAEVPRTEPAETAETGPDADARALRFAALQLEQRESGTDYAAREMHGEWSAQNPSHDFGVTLASDGRVELAAREGDASLQFVALGRGERTEARALTASKRTPQGARYEREGGLSEWYVNGRHGLEQGFELEQKPPGEGCLAIEVAFEGLTPMQQGDDEVALMRNGERALTYEGLFVQDASGVEVPASMEVRDQRIALLIDDSSARYPLRVDPFLVETRLRPSSTLDDGDLFGAAVSIDGDYAAVGAYHDDDVVDDAGAVYVFVRGASGWTQQQKITVPGAGLDHFGRAVSLSGSQLLVGAWRENISGLGLFSGAAYLYERSGTTWSLTAKLLPDDQAAGDQVGSSVAMDGGNAVVGAPGANAPGASNAGAVYVFRSVGGTWTQVNKLTATTPVAGAKLGTSVDVDGRYLVAGAPFETSETGAAYVFLDERPWVQDARLVANDAATGHRFGFAVAIEPNMVVAGAPRNGLGGGVYVFERSAVRWDRGTKLDSGYVSTSLAEHFGYSVSLSDGVILAGARSSVQFGGLRNGAAHVFVQDGSLWEERPSFGASDGVAELGFGWSVRLNGSTAIVGGPQSAATGPGRAYVYDFDLTVGDSCSVPGDCDSGFCVDGFCCETECAGGANDCQACSNALTGAGNGTCAVFDFGTACGDPTRTACSQPDLCDGLGFCRPLDQPAGANCATSNCDDDACDGAGNCVLAFTPAGTNCGSILISDCTGPDTCDGAGTCDENHAAGGAPCGDDTTNRCTLPDSCDGAGECNENHGSDGIDCFGSEFCRAGDTCMTGICREGSDDACAAGVMCNEFVDMCGVPTCGDGVTIAGEECDDGVDNSDTEPNSCRESCVAAFCGDGVVDDSEQCDETSAACNTSCLRAGVDAGTGDGGTIDGGSTDAGFLDAMVGDGGATDWDVDGGIEESPSTGGGCGCTIAGAPPARTHWLYLVGAIALGALVGRKRWPR